MKGAQPTHRQQSTAQNGSSSKAVQKQPAVCKSAGCDRPSWNGASGEYCSRTCRDRDRESASSLSGIYEMGCELGSQFVKYMVGDGSGDATSGTHEAPKTHGAPKTHEAPKPILFDMPHLHGVRITKLLAFYYPGRMESWDKQCRAEFLGNFYEDGMPQVRLKIADKNFTFNNAEAAYHALKFPNCAGAFQDLTGQGAFDLKNRLSGNEDWTFAGHKNRFLAMKAVLASKFHSGSEMANRLLSTGSSFLLEHNSRPDKDSTWSDNCDGTGSNWLGMLLMLRRDEIRGEFYWSKWLRQHVDLNDGAPLSNSLWQHLVQEATNRLFEAMPQLSPPKPHYADWPSTPPSPQASDLGAKTPRKVNKALGGSDYSEHQQATSRHFQEHHSPVEPQKRDYEALSGADSAQSASACSAHTSSETQTASRGMLTRSFDGSQTSPSAVQSSTPAQVFADLLDLECPHIIAMEQGHSQDDGICAPRDSLQAPPCATVTSDRPQIPPATSSSNYPEASTFLRPECDGPQISDQEAVNQTDVQMLDGQDRHVNLSHQHLGIQGQPADVQDVEMTPARREAPPVRFILPDSRVELDIVDFPYSGHAQDDDPAKRVSFLGNFFDTPFLVEDKEGKSECRFFNAEAAFQALKFWNFRHSFCELTPNAAIAHRFLIQPNMQSDFSSSGYANSWEAQLAVLRGKFKTVSLAESLLQTEDAFLLVRPTPHEQMSWFVEDASTFPNMLGLQLMIVRNDLRRQKTRAQPLVDWKSYAVKQDGFLNASWYTCVDDAVARSGL